jgi:hypothetical protein
MKTQTQFQGSISRFLRKTIGIFLLLLVPVFAVNAQPQSFFISPGQSIHNGEIKKIYCLEYSKDVLNSGNMAELTRITGGVRVIYKNGRGQTSSLQDLLNSKRIAIVPLNSYQYLRFVFLDETIAQIRTGREGIGLFREKMTEYENTLARTNIQKIVELEAQGKSHTEVQSIIWRIRIPVKIVETEKQLIIDLQTTEKEEDKVRSTFTNSSTVSFSRGNALFLRVDGLLGTDDINKFIIDLITHYHADHISRSAVEQALSEGNLNRLVAPNPVLPASQNEVFSMLNEYRELTQTVPGRGQQVLDIRPDGNSVEMKTTAIGNFTHSSFRVNEDISVEMFKNNDPHDVNNDGLIYKINHKNVSYLLFGDADRIDSLENLLDASTANETRRAEIVEEISNLRLQRLEAIDDVNVIVLSGLMMLEELGKNPDLDLDDLEEQQEMAEILTDYTGYLLERQYKIIAELDDKIKKLEEEHRGLPVLKADVIKYMHHAKFEDNERWISFIIKLNEVVDPQYIIWQHHHKQSAEEFKEYIEKRFPFHKKFLSSDDREIIIISLEWLITAGRLS